MEFHILNEALRNEQMSAFEANSALRPVFGFFFHFDCFRGAEIFAAFPSAVGPRGEENVRFSKGKTAGCDVQPAAASELFYTNTDEIDVY